MAPKSLNILNGELDIVFVALNPTKEAIKNKAVFSTDRGFWNILDNAEITNGTKKYPLNDLANNIFMQNCCSELKLGFADLVDDVYEKNSNNVKVPRGKAIALSNTIAKHKTKKIGLLGQKVVDAFARDYKGLQSWKKKNGFGEIGTISISKVEMKVFKLPFPVNSSIKDKHEYYKELID